MWRIRNFRQGIKNLIKWFPIIWKDRDWDYEFCEKILLFKLKEMQKEMILKKDTIVDWEYHKKEAQALKICINILERRKEDWYTDFYMFHRNGNQRSLKLQIIDKIENRDWKTFCKLFTKYFQCWWE